jgi:DNA/RNA-binding domain of Phe-tRNA-synthetase-like protein
MITAHDWTTNTTIDPTIWDRWPDYRVWLVAADQVDTSRLAAGADDLFQQATDSARADDDVDRHVLRWQDAYRDFGVKPRVARSSVDALLRRAGSDNGLPRINVLVDVYNAISILHRVPIGGEDLDRYGGPARLQLASGNETFHTTSHGEPVIEHPEPGEPVWVDDTGVTCRRWNWRQTTRTAIEPDTRRVGFIIDSLDAPDHHGARRAADHLAALVGDAHTRMIEVAGGRSC